METVYHHERYESKHNKNKLGIKAQGKLEVMISPPFLCQVAGTRQSKNKNDYK